MSSFDALFAVNLLLALVALWRLRVSLFIFIGNQALVLRALANIGHFGQPASQSYVPGAVFSQGNLEIATTCFALTTLYAALFVLLPSRGASEPPQPLPAVPRWVLWLLLVYFLLVIFSAKTLFGYSYVDPEIENYRFNLSGAGALLDSILLYEAVRRVRGGLVRPLTAFCFILLVFTLTDFLRGSTGLASGFVFTALVLLLGAERSPGRRWLTIGTALGVVLSLVMTVRSVRYSLHSKGLGAVSDFSSSLGERERTAAATGEGVETIGNGAQYAAHTLECITLYESGVSRDWRSIYMPILYTVQPRFVIDLLGFERPREAAWELGDYFIHGGGIYVLGELYWNGGYLCVALVGLAMFGFAFLCDTRSRHSFPWLLMLCMFAPNTLQGTGYGFAQVSRGFFNGLLALSAYYIARKLLAPRRKWSSPAAEAAPQ